YGLTGAAKGDPPADPPAAAASPDAPPDLDLADLVRQAVSAGGKFSAPRPGPAIAPPSGTWQVLYTDGQEGGSVRPDLATLEAQQTEDLLWFRLTAYTAWGNPMSDFNFVILLDTDSNPTTGFRGGEYLLIGGSIPWNNFGVPALLFNSALNPVALPHHIVL